jgi:hypothetical protein
MSFARSRRNETYLQRTSHTLLVTSLKSFGLLVSGQIFFPPGQSETRIAIGGHVFFWMERKRGISLKDLTNIISKLQIFWTIVVVFGEKIFLMSS